MFATFQTRLRFALLAGLGFLVLAWIFMVVGWIVPEYACDGLAIASGIDAAWLAVLKQQARPDPDDRRR